MNSQMQWDDHVVGQKHLRAVKLAEVAAAAVQNLPAPSRTPSPPDSYHGTDMTDASKLTMYFLDFHNLFSIFFSFSMWYSSWIQWKL